MTTKNHSDKIMLFREIPKETLKFGSDIKKQTKIKVRLILKGKITDQNFYENVYEIIENGMSRKHIIFSLIRRFQSRIADLMPISEGDDLLIEYYSETGNLQEDGIHLYNDNFNEK